MPLASSQNSPTNFEPPCCTHSICKIVRRNELPLHSLTLPNTHTHAHTHMLRLSVSHSKATTKTETDFWHSWTNLSRHYLRFCGRSRSACEAPGEKRGSQGLWVSPTCLHGSWQQTKKSHTPPKEVPNYQISKLHHPLSAYSQRKLTFSRAKVFPMNSEFWKMLPWAVWEMLIHGSHTQVTKQTSGTSNSQSSKTQGWSPELRTLTVQN